MEFKCPNCNEVLATEIEVAVGQHVICPYCERKFAYGSSEVGSNKKGKNMDETQLAQEWALQKNDEIDAKIRSKICDVRNAQGLPAISCPWFICEKGELVYHVQKDVQCTVPRASGDEQYGTGTLVVTNKRVVFTNERHRQIYKTKNLRDFTPCWSTYRRKLTIGTSDRRKECYEIDDAWICSFVIMYMFSDYFREVIFADEANAFSFMRSKFVTYHQNDYVWEILRSCGITIDSVGQLTKALGWSSYIEQIRGNRELRGFVRLIDKWNNIKGEHPFCHDKDSWLKANFNSEACRSVLKKWTLV